MQQPPYGPYGHQSPHAQPYAAAPTQAGVNPYAPPGPAMYRQNFFVPPGAAAGPLVSPSLKTAKLVVGIGQVLSLLAGASLLILSAGARGDTRDVLVGGGLASLGLWYMLLFGYALVNGIWLYKFWSWIPPEQRHTSMWKKYVSPGMAIGFMFIPYFNIYWMFVVYLGIAEIMERLRVQYPTSKGPAKTSAILAIVVPMLFFPAGPFLQFFFARHVEQMAEEMSARMTGARAHVA